VSILTSQQSEWVRRRNTRKFLANSGLILGNKPPDFLSMPQVEGARRGPNKFELVINLKTAMNQRAWAWEAMAQRAVQRVGH
jgi:hypothetical protein